MFSERHPHGTPGRRAGRLSVSEKSHPEHCCHLVSKSWPFFLLTLLATTALGQSIPERNANTSADSSALIAFFHEPFDQPLGYRLFAWDAKERILSRFGDPDSRKASRYASRTSQEKLWSTTYTYSGISFVIGESEDRSRTWIEKIDVQGGDHALAYSLRIGSTRSDVEAAFRDTHYIEFERGLRFEAEIWEARGQKTLTAAMELRIELGADDRVTRFLIESIEL